MPEENKVKDKKPTKEQTKIELLENKVKSLEHQISILGNTANTLIINIKSIARDFSIISNSIPNMQEHLQTLVNNIQQNKVLTQRKVA